jgi:hypothetical protein
MRCQIPQRTKAAKLPIPARRALADIVPTPPVKVAAGALIVPVELLDVIVELMASQVVKFWPPKKTPTVWASAKCSMWSMAAVKVAFVAQKFAVKLNAVAAPLHTGVAVVPS